MQAHPPPVDVGTETDGQLQEAQAALEAQRSQVHALKRRILELQVSPQILFALLPFQPGSFFCDFEELLLTR